MTVQRFKHCNKCKRIEPRRWTEPADYTCARCIQYEDQKARDQHVARVLDRQLREAGVKPKVLQAPRSMANKSEATALRSDPTRRALRNQGDDLDPLNPLSLTSPLNPIYSESMRPDHHLSVNDRNDWDSSSHRNHTSHSSSHSSHDDGGSYDSGSSDSGSSGGCD